MSIFAKSCVKCRRKEGVGEKFANLWGMNFCPEHAMDYTAGKYDLSAGKKRSIIANLIDTDQKTAKRFERGQLASANSLSGD